MSGITETIDIFRSIIQYPLVKLGIGVGVGISGFFFDGVLAAAMWALLFLIIFDFVTAIMAVIQAGEAIESRKMGKTAKKILIYYMGVSAGFLTETATHGILPIIDETLLVVFALTELVSILENMGRMGYQTPNTLLNRLRNMRDGQ